ncbi:hypothetical protein [Streptomyces sp. NPDC093097]
MFLSVCTTVAWSIARGLVRFGFGWRVIIPLVDARQAREALTGT